MLSENPVDIIAASAGFVYDRPKSASLQYEYFMRGVMSYTLIPNCVIHWQIGIECGVTGRERPHRIAEAQESSLISFLSGLFGQDTDLPVEHLHRPPDPPPLLNVTP
jgi:hypothetical protein